MNKDILSDIRNSFDFQFVPSLIHSEDWIDFVIAIINSDGQVFAEIMNDYYSDIADNLSEQINNTLFRKEDFNVVHGKVNDNTLMVIVQMPKDEGYNITCTFYVFVCNSKENNVRYFTVEKDVISNVLCEITKDKERLVYGEIVPTMRKVMECVSEIVR